MSWITNSLDYKMKAKFIERINIDKLEDMKARESFLDGSYEIKFNYSSKERAYNTVFQGLQRAEDSIVIATRDSTEFKDGDLIIIDRKTYTIKSVRSMIDEKYLDIVNRCPGMESEYTVKYLLLV